MSSGRAVLALLLLVFLVACTLARPLDEYSASLDEPGDADGGDATTTPEAAADAPSGGDAGDGCNGNPQIITPAPGATVGSSFRLTVSAPSCLTRLTLYIDDAETLKFTGSSIDQQVPIAIGAHRISVNGWAGTAQAHKSMSIAITRAK